MGRTVLTEQNKQDIRTLYGDQKSCLTISRQLKLNRGTIRNYLLTRGYLRTPEESFEILKERLSKEVRKCKHCKSLFNPNTYKQDFCCEKHRLKHNYEKALLNGRKKEYNKRTRGRSPESFIKSIVRSSSKQRKNVSKLNLDYREVINIYYQQKGLCALTGKELTWQTGKGRVPTNISIDRIDSSKDYSKDNIQLVCHLVNIMKYTSTKEDLLSWCQSILEYNK